MPYFQLTDQVILTDSTAIAKHFIRNSNHSASLLGSGAFAEAQIEQYVSMASSSVIPLVRTIEATTFGTKIDPSAHAKAVGDLKKTCNVLNLQL